MKKFHLLTGLIILSLLIGLTSAVSAQKTLPILKTEAATATFDVPLTVYENGGVTRTDDPVTWGIPLSKYFGVTNPNELQMTDSLGMAVPAQFTVLARWGGAPEDASKPIKWILADFQANVAADSSAIYHLKNGTSPTHPTPIVVSESASGYEVNTGRARFIVSKTSFHLFDQIYVDRDGNSTLNESVLNGTGRITATYNGISYYADTSLPEETALEINGPLHTVLRVRGWLKDANGANKLLAYTARIHFYAGTATARLEFTVWNDNLIANVDGQPAIKEFGSPNTVLFDGMTVKLQLANATTPTYTLAGMPSKTWNGTLTGAASLYQDSSGGAQWHHDPDTITTTFRGFQADVNGSVVHAACNESAASAQCRSRGWGGLSGNGAGVLAGVRYFWENYPKEIALQSDGTVRVGLFPARYGTPFELRVGEQKSHEILFYFGQGNAAETMTALQHPMQAWASSEYYLNEVKVFDRIHPNAASNPNFTDYEGYVDAGILFPQYNLFVVREGGVGSNWVFSPRPESWGWRNFGDVIAEDETGGGDWPVFTNLQYDHPWGYLSQAVRATSRDKNLVAQWWYLTEAGALHTADVDIIHSRCAGQSLDDMQACTDPAVPYPIGWAMGGRLTNQWHAWPVPSIHRNAAIDYWSGGIRGMLNYYYFSGDGMVKDSWMQLSENARWRIENYSNNNPGEFDGRLPAYGIEIMTDAYNATGDPAYLAAAQQVVAASHPNLTWFGQPGYFPDPNVSGSGKSTGPWILSMIMKSLGNYLDMTVEWTGQADPAAQDSLMRYAELQTSWWRLGEAEPACWTIYENGGCSRYYWNFSLPDGLAWALIYNDGRLNPNTAISVATDAWQKSLNDPWAGYPKNTFLSSKQHAMQNISGTAWMWYSIHCTNGATDPACSYGSASPALGLSAVSHDFGNQGINLTSSAYTFTVTNTGTADLHLGTFTFNGEFNASNNLCNGQSLAPGGVCTFGVTFTPLSVGAKTGAVSIPSDAASSPDIITLSGNGIVQLSASFTSAGGHDGHIVETNETANTGVTASVSGGTLTVGDYALNRQVRSLLHFNSQSLPDNAVVAGVILKLKRQSFMGTNPFLTFGNLQVDIARPFFGTEVRLKPADFQAASNASIVGFFNPTPATGNWYSASLDPSAFPYINLTGTTQFRLAFSLDDNNNKKTDLAFFYSGNFKNTAYRPVLVVNYYVP